MTGTVNVKSTCNQIVDTIGQIIAIGMERKVLPLSIVKELSGLSAVAGAIAIQEEKAEVGELARELQRPLTVDEERKMHESTRRQHFEGFHTFRSRITESDLFNTGASSSPASDLFTSGRQRRETTVATQPSESVADLTGVDFADPEEFAKRYS